jgi:hypothetical protein
MKNNKTETQISMFIVYFTYLLLRSLTAAVSVVGSVAAASECELTNRQIDYLLARWRGAKDELCLVTKRTDDGGSYLERRDWPHWRNVIDRSLVDVGSRHLENRDWPHWRNGVDEFVTKTNSTMRLIDVALNKKIDELNERLNGCQCSGGNGSGGVDLAKLNQWGNEINWWTKEQLRWNQNVDEKLGFLYRRLADDRMKDELRLMKIENGLVMLRDQLMANRDHSHRL